ncbi:MAG: ATP phosphoribosyltransferase regulatory subunit [Pseudomonadales bacterium]|nr:ATP phosphoribosyltransferase regulatory subunit [Pseudomonadales bacterium]
MTSADRWLLPDGVDEILPPQASRLEQLRREVLDLYACWGYELVITPLIEFLDSLLIVPGNNELQLQTFKIVDQLSGRSMGVRADITSQVARIDAHGLQRATPTRLCYADSVLHTRPQSLLGSRSPIRIGAELYGHAGTASDIEVITLMLETLAVAGIDKIHLALGHVHIYRSLIRHAALDAALERKLFDAIQRKSCEEITTLLQDQNTDGDLLEMLNNLIHLSGGEDILDQAERLFRKAPDGILAAIESLREITRGIRQRFPRQTLYYDLSELRGYQYHTGVVFATYVPGYGDAIAKGGRYDHIGEVFGRARPATGFDADLKILLALGSRAFHEADKIFAPALADAELQQLINQLRADGQVVVTALEGQTESARDMACSQEIVRLNNRWQVRPIN